MRPTGPRVRATCLRSHGGRLNIMDDVAIWANGSEDKDDVYPHGPDEKAKTNIVLSVTSEPDIGF